MDKTLYCVSVTRGRKTIYRFGKRLKDAVALLRLKHGESFQYVKYTHTGVVKGEWLGSAWAQVA